MVEALHRRIPHNLNLTRAHSSIRICHVIYESKNVVFSSLGEKLVGERGLIFQELELYLVQKLL